MSTHFSYAWIFRLAIIAQFQFSFGLLFSFLGLGWRNNNSYQSTILLDKFRSPQRVEQKNVKSLIALVQNWLSLLPIFYYPKQITGQLQYQLV
jgi:hypothetical protein